MPVQLQLEVQSAPMIEAEVQCSAEQTVEAEVECLVLLRAAVKLDVATFVRISDVFESLHNLADGS